MEQNALCRLMSVCRACLLKKTLTRQHASTRRGAGQLGMWNGWRSLPGLLGNPGPALLLAALLFAALPEEAVLLAPLLLAPPEDTAQPLFGQTVLM